MAGRECGTVLGRPLLAKDARNGAPAVYLWRVLPRLGGGRGPPAFFSIKPKDFLSQSSLSGQFGLRKTQWIVPSFPSSTVSIFPPRFPMGSKAIVRSTGRTA